MFSAEHWFKTSDKWGCDCDSQLDDSVDREVPVNVIDGQQALG